MKQLNLVLIIIGGTISGVGLILILDYDQYWLGSILAATSPIWYLYDTIKSQASKRRLRREMQEFGLIDPNGKWTGSRDETNKFWKMKKDLTNIK